MKKNKLGRKEENDKKIRESTIPSFLQQPTGVKRQRGGEKTGTGRASRVKSLYAAPLTHHSNSSDRDTYLNVNDSEYDYSLFMDSDGRLDSS